MCDEDLRWVEVAEELGGADVSFTCATQILGWGQEPIPGEY